MTLSVLPFTQGRYYSQLLQVAESVPAGPHLCDLATFTATHGLLDTDTCLAMGGIPPISPLWESL
jgi:hypothetical protein